jgi:type IV pilus assembly protein PilY1
VALGGQPLFSAGNTQPITVMPEITAIPNKDGNDNGGVVISFGTGSSFQTEDVLDDSSNINRNTQTIYGIWDKPSEPSSPAFSTITKALLKEQTMKTSLVPVNAFETTDNKLTVSDITHGWYLDLKGLGERVNIPPQQVVSVLFVVANTPSVDRCSNGGSSRIFALDPVTGSAPPSGVFDVSTPPDGKFDDGYNVQKITSGVLTQPIFQLSSKASSTIQPGVSVAPFALFYRGQTGGSRAGGVELSKTSGALSSSSLTKTLCELIFSGAISDTTIINQNIKVCSPPGKARTSWRQLR